MSEAPAHHDRDRLPDHAPELDHLAEDLGAAMRDIGAHAGALYLCDPAEGTLTLCVLSGIPRDLVRSFNRIAPTAALPVPDAIRERRLVWVPNGEELARLYPRAAITLPYEFSVAAHPLVSNEEVHGGFALFGTTARPTRLSPAERRTLSEAARSMVDRLDKAHMLGRSIRPSAAPITVRPPDPADREGGMLGTTVERLREGLCCLDVNGRFTLVTDTAAELLGRNRNDLLGSRPWTALPWLNDPVYEDRYRAAIMSHRWTEFVALRPPDRWLSFHLYPDASGISVLITPTEVDAREGGAQHVDKPRALPTRVGALYHILHLASALSEAASVNDVIDLVAQEILPAVGASALGLFTLDRGRRRLETIGHRGFGAEFVQSVEGTPADARTPAARAASGAVPSFFRARRELSLVYPDQDVSAQEGLEAWAFLPLIASGHPVGTCVLAFARTHNFTVQERAVLNALGGLMAQALERARLYDLKLELVRGLQAGMLPSSLPRVRGLSSAARYLPGTEGMDIGGDFYDLIPLGPDSAAAVIGDVQGHNVSAAALMGQLRTAVLAHTAVSDGEPGQVLAGTNELLCHLDSDLFASCVYLRLDLVTGRVRMARAGHPEPLLCGPRGSSVLESPEGLLLGIDPDAKYPVREFTLGPGSVLALYTDGLIEAPGVDLDDAKQELAAQFGELAGLPVEQAADELTSQVRTEAHRRDDIALLLLRADLRG